MFAVCCVPYLTRRQVLISNKAKVVAAGEETLLCTLELKNKDTSARIDNIRLEYELYARSSLVEEPNVAHCCVSRISRDKCNIFINVSESTVVKLTKVILDLGWKYRLADNEIKFKIKTASPMLSPISSANSSKPDISALSMSDEYSPRLPNITRLQLNKSPVSKCYVSPSPSPTESSFSFSDHEGRSQRTTSYYLSYPQASAHQSSVEAALLPDGIGLIEAGTPVHFKVKVKDTEGEALPKRSKLKLIVKLGDETIFSGVTHKKVFKLTKVEAREFAVLFYINDELVPGNPFYVNVLPLPACSISNFAFDEDCPRVKRYKTQSDAMYVKLGMICHADIIDKYGNKVHENCDVKVMTKPVIEVTAVHVNEGQLQFKTKAVEIGQVEFSFILKEEGSQTEIMVKKEVYVKQLSMDDQFAFKTYI